MVRADRPSKSARDVAAACAMRGLHPRYAGLAPAGLPAELAAALVVSGAVTVRARGRIGRRLARARLWAFHAFLDLYERALLPGMSAHLLVRKRWFEDEVRAAVAAGARQLVVLGAGYDLVAERALREHPDLAVLEVDHPPTQALKRRVYAAHVGGGPALVPLDLAQVDLEAALRAHPRFEPGAPSVFVAEGLVMYLERDEVRALLATFRDLTGPGSRLLWTALDADARGRASFGRFPAVLRAFSRWGREPLRWGVSRDGLAPLVEASGLRVLAAPTRTELERRYLPDRGHGLLRLGRERFAVLERP